MAKKQKVKHNGRGAFVTYYGRRIYLHEVIRADSSETERVKLSKKYDSHVNDVAIGYYDINYKIYILGHDEDGDAVGMVEFIAVSH